MVNRISLLIILAVVVFGVLKFSVPEATNCADMPAPQIKFIDNENKLTSNFTVARKQLTRIKQKHDQIHAPYMIRGNTLGLTLADYGYSLELQTGYKKAHAWSSKACPYIKNVWVEFNYGSEIYVAKEYVPNRCAFDIILKHEYGHHHVNITNKKTYLAWLENDLPVILQEISKNLEPVSLQDFPAVSQKIREEIKDVLDTYIQNMYHNTMKDNEKLDTMAEYLRLNKAIAQCFKKKRF
jgi:hypothetical protein